MPPAGRIVATIWAALILSLALAIAPTSVFQAQDEDEPPDLTAAIGAEVGGYEHAFVDLMKYTRPWEPVGGGELATDDAGWPLGDAFTVVFDYRPCCVFFPESMNNSIDDPSAFQFDMSGIYHLSFTGEAVVVDMTDTEAFSVENQRYDAASDTTTAEIVFRPGHLLMILGFVDTDGGVRDVRLIKPGFPADTELLFDPRWVDSLRPYSTLRFMAWVDANSNAGIAYSDADNLLDWDERRLPTDATQQSDGRKFGVAWEYAVLLANLLEKDVWLTIPHPASDDYVRQLAVLLRDGNEYTNGTGLKRGLRIYLEDSNEVWNFGFPQQPYNFEAARDEVATNPESRLNVPETSTENNWAVRRHARRVVQISGIFRGIFGGDAMLTRVRPVLSWWVIQPVEYLEMLNWIEATYGPPANFLYAISGTSYFNMETASDDADVTEILTALCESSAATGELTARLSEIADQYGLSYLAYEGGPDSANAARTAENIGPRVLAARTVQIGQIVEGHIREQFFGRGGDLFMYFTSFGRNIRFGYYGATEDWRDLYTPQLQAIYRLTGQSWPEIGGGLYGVYFSTPDLSERVAGSRVDPTINFAWGEYSPAWENLILPFDFTVRWGGEVRAPMDSGGELTLTVKAEGGARLYWGEALDLFLNTWDDDATDESVRLTVEAGAFYPITLDFRSGDRPNSVQLLWSWDGQPAQVIPQEALYPIQQRVDFDAEPACASVEVVEAPAPSATDTPDVLRLAPVAPVIDGVIDEVWLDIPPLVMANEIADAGTVDGPEDLSGSVRVMYDADGIYALYHIIDDVIVDDSENTWEDDSVELYIDGGNEKSPGIYDENDRVYGFDAGQTEAEREDGVVAVSVLTGRGYLVEAFVPWSAVGVIPRGGMAIGFDALVNDDDDGGTRDGKIGWFATLETNWYDPSAFGTLTLEGEGLIVRPPVVPFAASAPMIDGEPDAAWDAAVVLPITRVLLPVVDDAADLSATVALLYDSEHLYALFTVNDDALFADSQNPWDDDSAELYLDGGNEKSEMFYDLNDEQYVFRYGVSVPWAQRGKLTGVQMATVEIDGGYRIEVAVPWANIAVTPRPGALVGFDAHLNDDDDGDGRDGKIALYAAQDDAWTNPAAFGTLELGPTE